MDEKPSKASILGALSQALDMVEGQPEGHALRTSRLALRIGRILGMNNAELEDLYFASVLKDSGCSNNSVRIHSIFGGDDFLSKRAVKTIDWSSTTESLKFALAHTERGQSIGAKLRRMAANLGPPKKVMNAVTEARCTRGAAIASKLNLSDNVASTILYLDEHWDGKGAPYGLPGPKIPLAARILCLAQTFEVFLMSFGATAAYDVIQKRNKKWFDPEVVAACRQLENDSEFWEDFGVTDLVEAELPWLNTSAIDADIDGICEAFAMIIDAKSSFTSQHSDRVSEYALNLGKYFGFDQERMKILKRAGLMHDIGKLGVSSGILEKPGKLDEAEFDQIKLHPKYSYMILRRIKTFESISEIASAHHERLDGRGYWRGLTSESLSLDVRVMTAADVFDALTAKRPYRDALPLEKVFEIMDKDAGTAFDPECIEGLKAMSYEKQIAA